MSSAIAAVAAALLLLFVVIHPASVFAQAAAPASETTAPAAAGAAEAPAAMTHEMPSAAPAPETEHGMSSDGAAHEEEHAGGAMASIAKIVNFLVLVGLVGYFVRTPISAYLAGRSDAIRKDLVEARALSASAASQLETVRAQLGALPAELAALEAHGREELANERVRLAEATAAAREKVLDAARRETDLQFRLARRSLVEHTANLAMSLAKQRIAANITPEDQRRLVERYATEVRS